ncbi:DUF2510 domain-containing protein [Galbitalea sp. SE-J8]|uniref:DUF2510 domain-containing protein n=1 Tax=Galbitalea sp. SE-J8 TaxID=3054952 RepID=UPI00259C6847|nr:DUF2510 domain-containing protein [Galbitalea sp. SE-J8]MDM4764073.1 DUF2510 domain-containing protein [Galbitalea sp. SE-J8]
MSDAPTPAAGWYHDPSGTPQQRWWNGTAWTDDVLPLDPTPDVEPAPHEPAPHAPAPHAPGPHGTGPHEPAPHAPAPQGAQAASPSPAPVGAAPAPHTPGAHTPAPPAPPDPTPYGAAPHDATPYGATPYGSPNHYPGAAHYPSAAHYRAAAPGGHPSAAASAPGAPAAPGVDGWPIWLAVLLHLVPVVPFLFWDPVAYAADLLAPAYRYVAPPVAALLPAAYWAIVALGLIAYAGAVVLAAVDARRLAARGVVNPFPWAFAFLGVLVYVIGRTVVVRRRLGRGGIGPLLTYVGVALVSVIVSSVWAVAVVVAFVSRMPTR